MIKHYFLNTVRTLRQNPLYTALSVFGIALTFVFVCILLLLVETGKGDYIPHKYEERTWQIGRLVDENTNFDVDIPKEIFEACVSKMKTPELIVLSSTNAMVQMVMEDKILQGMINCVNENFFDVYRFKFLRGRPLNKQEIADGLPVAVIDKYIAEQYFGKYEDPTGKNIEFSGIRFRVTGVVDNVSLLTIGNGFANANIWIPYKAASTILNVQYQISFTGKDESSVADMQAEFSRVLDEINAAEDTRYVIPDWQKDSLSQRGGLMVSGMTLFLIVLILMLIPALNILSLNVSKSHDRSEEIAVRKAFGAPGHTVFGQLFVENTIITLLGAVLGMCITSLIFRAIDNMMLGFAVFPVGFSLQFNWATIFWIAGPCTLLFSFLSGSIPAWMTSKREIVNVLKGEVYTTITSNWTRRRKLAWVFIEQALVFAILLFCFTILVEKIVVYFSKGDVNVDNVFIIDYQAIDEITEDEKEANDAMFRSMVESMKGWQSVELISVNRNATPIFGGIRWDSISFNNHYDRASIRYCDENFYRMFSPVLTEGEWFRDIDASLETPPALVTQRLLDDFDFTGSAIGQIVYYQGRTYRITGVIEAFKERNSRAQLSALFIPVSPTESNIMYAVKNRQGMGSDFSKAFIAEFYRNFPRDRFNPEFMDLTNFSKQSGLLESLQIYVFGIPTAFLLIFAFLGTFGVIWVQSKKRMSEFGLRIAFGCTPMRLMRKIIFENLALTTLAMVPGLIVVAFLYAYAPKGWEWTAAIGAAVALMWLFSAISAWFPAWKASKVHPVEALKSSQ